MKRVLTIMMLCIFIFTIPLYLNAAESKGQKIAFVDMNKVLEESNLGKEAIKTIKAFVNSKEEMLAPKIKEVQDLENELLQQSSAMSEEAKRKKQDKILDLKRELQKIEIDVQKEVREKQAQLIEPFSKDIKSLLETIAKEKGYTVIFPMNLPIHQHAQTPEGNSVIVPDNRPWTPYISPDADITKLVLERYNNLKKTK